MWHATFFLIGYGQITSGKQVNYIAFFKVSGLAFLMAPLVHDAFAADTKAHTYIASHDEIVARTRRRESFASSAPWIL